MSRILIVDDDSDVLSFCDAALGAQGHEAVTCSNPRKALATLADHGVDLLVVDVVMPGFNGFDFLRECRRGNRLHAPVLILTGRRSPSDIQTALELGATDYMVKPFDKDVFLKKVESILGLRAAAPDVRFASGAANSKGVLSLPILVSKVTEMGVTLRTTSWVDRKQQLTLSSDLFDEIGIAPPPLRVASCTPIEDDTEYHYEVFLSFIGLDETAMRKIRRWIASRAILTRKAA
jgi:DNA-binding response OmpR family regulator